MGDQKFDYDVFLSHASEDTEWCKRLAERLRRNRVRIWFDEWELKPGHHLETEINNALARSRKMVAVWSENYFLDRKLWTYAEAFSAIHPDPTTRDRRLIPILLTDCRIPPLLHSLIHLDFRNEAFYELQFRRLIESLDLPLPKFSVDHSMEDIAEKFERGLYTDSWIDREETKGRLLDRTIKEALSLELAWRIWSESKEERGIHYRELEDFLRPLFAGKHMDFGDHELDEVAREMQVASFLRRVDHDGRFGFMHKSFMEFFLARKLHDAFDAPARHGEIAPLLLVRRYDKELINFFTQLDRADVMLRPLQTILTGPYRPDVSENALQLLYWSGRCRAGMKDKIEDRMKLQNALGVRIPVEPDLRGANLTEAVFECLPLRGADLREADLTRTNLNHAMLSEVDLRGAKMIEMRAEDAALSNVDLREADLNGASFNGSSWSDGDLSGARMKNVSLNNVTWRDVKGLRAISRQSLLPIVQRGHGGPVRAVAYGPDGELMASGGNDGLILIRRVSDGKLLRSLEGHTSSVRSVAFAPDGSTLASGSDDKSVRLWEIESGKLLMELRGALGSVHAVAFEPNGKYLVAAGAAGQLQFWDLARGETFLYLYDFGEGAWLSFLPDGRFDASPEGMRYLSYTEEGTNNSYDAEELAKEFYDPGAVREVLAKFV